MRPSMYLVVAALLPAVACGGSSEAPAGRAPSSSESWRQIRVAEYEFHMEDDRLNLYTGTYRFVVSNKGRLPHDLDVLNSSGKEVGATPSLLKAGEGAEFSVALVPGSYIMVCSVPGHRQQGMEGKITVE
jgi:uncharacterized cupredoxin-like copper-binding protein